MKTLSYLGVACALLTASVALAGRPGAQTQQAALGAPAKPTFDAPSIGALKAKYRRPAAPEFPNSNPYSREKEVLGKALFFDPRLSRSGAVSCASCHNPAFRWSDGLQRGVGVTGQKLPRRTPSVMNAAWLTSFMWDGRADSLEQQAALPMTAEHEMGMPLDDIVARVASIPGYKPMFDAAFPNKLIAAETILAALATYERTLVSNKSPFDRWIEGEENAIAEEAKRGFVVFNGAGRCSKCHSGWRFTDDSFHDIGLDSTDVGRGRYAPPSVAIMQHAFKTPSLRETNFSGPQMHDGSMTSLDEVITHYEKGGKQRPSLSPEMKKITLTERERADLIGFLQTLPASPLTTEVPVLP